MQRGIRLFNSLTFFENDAPPVVEKPHRGRNPEFINKRNLLIAVRYYYYAKMMRLQYPDVLSNLEVEFFISKTMVQRIVQELAAEMVAMKRTPPTIKSLKEKYNWLSW